MATKTWATCFQLKSSVQNTSTHPATPQITSTHGTHVSYVPSAKMLMHRCTHTCALLSSGSVEEFHGLAGTGLVLKWTRPGETVKPKAKTKKHLETQTEIKLPKLMGASLLDKTVEVFLQVLFRVPAPVVEHGGHLCSCPCVNIPVLTFTVHQDVGATTNQFAVNAFPKEFLLSFVACIRSYQS